MLKRPVFRRRNQSEPASHRFLAVNADATTDLLEGDPRNGSGDAQFRYPSLGKVR